MVNLSPKTKVYANVALHLLVWGFWFTAPILLNFNDPQKNEPPRNPSFYFFIWIPMTFSLILFYLNYFVLVDRFLFNKRILWFLTVNLLLIFLFSYFSEFIREAFRAPMPDRGPSGNRPPKEFFFGLRNLTFFFIVSISVAIRTTSRWFKTENERKNLENENLKSELSYLKMQLNPHFFFNTLNNIYALIENSPGKAQESVHGLAKLMRYHLYETNEERVSLSGEIEIMKNYINLMKLRLTSNTEVESIFQVENPQTLVAPLLFIPLIENSFKHGVNPNEKSQIRISLIEKNQLITFESYNEDFPQKYTNDNNIENNGIGLENLQKRLLLIYPEKHTFIKEYVNNKFHVKVMIQL